MWKAFRIIPVLLSLALVSGPALAEAIDINTASQDQLTQLNGVGPVKAQAIIAYRDQHGPFRSVADLTEVTGIGPAFLRENQGMMSASQPEASSP